LGGFGIHGCDSLSAGCLPGGKNSPAALVENPGLVPVAATDTSRLPHTACLILVKFLRNSCVCYIAVEKDELQFVALILPLSYVAASAGSRQGIDDDHP
jgi:hypothetical protein